jgi:hypothetical protein
MSLSEGFNQEAWFLAIKGWLGSIEDVVIPMLPDEPDNNHENFHEKVVAELASSF